MHRASPIETLSYNDVHESKAKNRAPLSLIDEKTESAALSQLLSAAQSTQSGSKPTYTAGAVEPLEKQRDIGKQYSKVRTSTDYLDLAVEEKRIKALEKDANLGLLAAQLYTKRYNEVFVPEQQKYADELEAINGKMHKVSELMAKLNAHMQEGSWTASTEEEKTLIDEIKSFGDVSLLDKAYSWDSAESLKQETDNLRAWTQTEGQKTSQIYARITESRKTDNNCYEAIKNALERDAESKKAMISNQLR